MIDIQKTIDAIMAAEDRITFLRGLTKPSLRDLFNVPEVERRIRAEMVAKRDLYEAICPGCTYDFEEMA